MKREPKGRNDGHIMDYTKITDQIFLGSDLCQGMVCPVHSVEFQELKIDAEINLSAERKEIPPDGIDSYTWLPVVDGYSPTQSQLDTGTAVMNEVIKEGKRVYIHCKNGHGRSPTLVLAYLIRFKNFDPEKAEEKVKEQRPEIHIEDSQRKELNKFYQRWSR